MRTQQRSFRDRILDPKNRRSKNIEDLRPESHRLNLNRAIELPDDFSAVGPHKARAARLKAELAKSERQMGGVLPPVRIPEKKRGLRNVKVGRR